MYIIPIYFFTALKQTKEPWVEVIMKKKVVVVPQRNSLWPLGERKRQLLQCVHALGEHLVPHDDHEDGHLAVHQRQGAVLQLPRLDALAVHVGQLLHLEGPLETGGEVVTPAHDEEGLLGVQLLGYGADLGVKRQHL